MDQTCEDLCEEKKKAGDLRYFMCYNFEYMGNNGANLDNIESIRSSLPDASPSVNCEGVSTLKAQFFCCSIYFLIFIESKRSKQISV